MYKKIFLLYMILVLLAIPIYAQDKIIENEYIDPFRNEKEVLGQIDVEIGMLEGIKNKDIEEVLKFRGVVKYNNFKAVILELNEKTFLLNKNETFNYLNETYRLVSVDNELILFNQNTFKEVELVENKEYGGVKYSVEIKE